jgi:hypothetical protein
VFGVSKKKRRKDIRTEECERRESARGGRVREEGECERRGCERRGSVRDM